MRERLRLRLRLKCISLLIDTTAANDCSKKHEMQYRDVKNEMKGFVKIFQYLPVHSFFVAVQVLNQQIRLTSGERKMKEKQYQAKSGH